MQRIRQQQEKSRGARGASSFRRACARPSLSALAVLLLAAAPQAEEARILPRPPLVVANGPPPEVPNDPPVPAALRSPKRTAAPAEVRAGPFLSVQVNVDPLGDNVVGDAANEPSIAVNPLGSDEIVIGWRQFDSVSSDFREAGYAYSDDGGETWTTAFDGTYRRKG